jgi:hypothetical protein
MRASTSASFILSRISLGGSLLVGAGISDVNRTMIRFDVGLWSRLGEGDVCNSGLLVAKTGGVFPTL